MTGAGAAPLTIVETMETLNQLKARFGLAFKKFSTEHSELRRMRAAHPQANESAWIHGINAQTTRVSEVEHVYRTVRLEYVKRLLRPRSGS